MVGARRTSGRGGPGASGNGRRRRRRGRRRSHRSLDGPCAPGARRVGRRPRGGDVRCGRERAQRRLPARLLVIAPAVAGRGRRGGSAGDGARRRRRDSRRALARRGRLARGRRAALRLRGAGSGRARGPGDRVGGRARCPRRGGAGRSHRPAAVACVSHRRPLPGRRHRAPGAAGARAAARCARL